MSLHTDSALLLDLEVPASKPLPSRPRITDITLSLSLPKGGERVVHLDPSSTNALVWSERAIHVLAAAYGSEGAFGPRRLQADEASHLFGSELSARLRATYPALHLASEGVLLAWNAPRDGSLPAALCTSSSRQLPALVPVDAAGDGPGRPRISGIQLTLCMPDGSPRTHTLDPKLSDALFWDDEAIRIFRDFYAPWGPAAGKLLGREHFETYFGAETTRRVFERTPSAREVLVTPETVDLLWTSPKDSGFAPAFLVKSVINPINGL